MIRQKIIVLTGAGVSAESGISTFRDNGGLWEQYDIMDVATPEAWERNQALVLEFYNQRRKQLYEVEPNAAHYALVKLEEKFDVHIITQNVDDLHERAGSSKVMHLHGELKKVRSSVDKELVYELPGWELKKGDTCERGSQLRPHIVWFGEEVPLFPKAAQLCSAADVLIIIGTSMNVYPAASLAEYTDINTPIYVIDPAEVNVAHLTNVKVIQKRASQGTVELVNELLEIN